MDRETKMVYGMTVLILAITVVLLVKFTNVVNEQGLKSVVLRVWEGNDYNRRNGGKEN